MSRNPDLYRVDGERVPSVTEVLEIAGVCSLPDVPSSLLEHKRRIGSEVHQWLEMIDRGMIESTDCDDGVVPYVAAYEKFLKEAGWQIIACEQAVVNETYRYAGTLDRVLGASKGRRALVDIKTGEAAPWVGLQTAGYELCLKEPHYRYALHLRADRTYRLIQYSDPADKHDFLACVRVAHYRLRHGEASIT